MPFIRCVYSGSLAARERLLPALSRAVAVSMGKDEAVVMCQVEHTNSLMYGGSTEPASMIQVESIGSDLSTIIASLTEVMTTEGGIDPERCFYNFRDVSAEHFGKNRDTIAVRRAAAAAAAAAAASK